MSSFVMVFHILLIGFICFAVSSVTKRRGGLLSSILACIAGIGSGVALSFVLSFFVYPSLEFVPSGEDFIFQTYALFRNGALLSIVFSILGAAFHAKVPLLK